MNMWCHLPTDFNYRFVLRFVALLSIAGALITTLIFANSSTALTTNRTISFQGRLQTSSGAIVADGYYNIQFKIYQGGTGNAAGNPGGSLKWTETYINNGNATGAVQVRNGHFSVELGSVTPFGSSIDWESDTMWLSMNVAGRDTACTSFGTSPCAADGEMLPMKRLTAASYAINAGALGGIAAENFMQLTDTPQTGNFNITGTGKAGAIQSASLDTASAGTLTIGGTNATSIALADNVTVGPGLTITMAGGDTAGRPVVPAEGMMYFDTTTKSLLVYANGKWQADRSVSNKIVGTSATGGASGAVASQNVDGADFVNTSTTSAQTVINSAISALPAGGGTVYLMDGTYIVDGTINVPSNVSVIGAGGATILKVKNATDATLTVITSAASSNVTLQAFTIEGNRANNSSGTQTGLDRANGGGSKFKIDRVTFQNFRSYGALIRSGTELTVTNSAFNGNNTYGLYVQNSDYSLISNNSATSNSSYGIFVAGSNNAVTGNSTQLNTGAGITVASSYSTVTGNNSNNNSHGIRITAPYVTVSGNTVNANTTGISMEDDNLTVSGNTVTANTTVGIQLSPVDDGLVTANTLSNNAGTGSGSSIVISSSSFADRNSITNNVITDTAGTGYAINLVNSNSRYTYLSNNSYSGTGAASINDLGTGTIYANQRNSSGALINAAAGGLVSKLISGSSADLFQAQNSSGTTLMRVTSTGALQSASLDTTSAGALTIGGTNATSIALADNVTVGPGLTITMAGGDTAGRPVVPAEGMMYFDTTTKQLLTYAGGKWQGDRSESVMVAASNSSDADKAAADYVADGTDDQVEINAALAAANPAGSGRKSGKVYLFAGTYTTHRTNNGDATILIPNNVTLGGAGMGTVIRLGDIDVSDNLIQNSDTTNGTGVTIRDLKIDGQDTLNTAGSQSGIYLQTIGNSTTQGAKVINVEVKDFREIGIVLDNAKNSIVERSVSHSSAYGISISWGSANNTITGNKFQNNSSTGMYLNDGTYNTITSNNVLDNGSGGINFESSSQFNTLTGNTLRGNGGNTIRVASANNTISGNTIYANGDAISFSGATNNTVNGNNVDGAGGSGVGFRLSSSANNNTINGNNFRNTGGATTNNAIFIDASDGNTITNNALADASCSTNCYAINISNSTSDSTYLSGNSFNSPATINDQGTGTIYSGQMNSSGQLINSSNGGLVAKLITGSTNDIFQAQSSTGAVLMSINSAGAIQGTSSLTLGTSSTTDGSFVLKNATNSNTATITSGATSASYTSILMTALGSVGQCLSIISVNGSSQQLGYSACSGGGGGGEVIQNTTSPQEGDFNITGTGTATSLRTMSLDSADTGTLTIGGTNSTDIAMESDVVVGSGSTLTVGNSAFDSTGRLGLGTTIPGRQLDISVNDANVDALPIRISQQGTGDNGIEFVTAGSSTYFTGVDATTGSFKLSSSVSAGISDESFGNTNIGANHESNSSNFIGCSVYDSGSGGIITSLKAHYYGTPSATPNNKASAAIYTNNGSSPSTLVAASSEITITQGWNTFPISATVSTSTPYWLCLNTSSSGTAGWSYDSSASGSMVFQSHSYDNVWNASFGSSSSDSRALSVYASYAANSNVDALDWGLLEISETGQTTLRNLNNSNSALRVQNAGGTSMFSVDTSNNRVRIGTGSGSGTPVMLTLDKASSAPSVPDQSAMLGSMYYDSTAGKVQCYEAAGWGDCGSKPDNFITLSPEYANAVTNGNGNGTMSSDFCSDTLDINDGSSGQPTVCGTNETYNFYKWTSAQATDQTKSFFVTYQLPSTFTSFVAGSTSLKGRTDSTDSTITYQVYRKTASGLTACGSATSVSTGAQTTWQTGTTSGTADPANCSFAAGDSVVFKITMTAKNNANVYASNLNFIYSNN